MSLRTVAGDTPSWERSAKALEPTGSLVETKSRTIARSTSSLRSSSIPGHLPPSVRHEHLPHWHSGLLALLACWHFWLAGTFGLLALRPAECQVYGAPPGPVPGQRTHGDHGARPARGRGSAALRRQDRRLQLRGLLRDRVIDRLAVEQQGRRLHDAVLGRLVLHLLHPALVARRTHAVGEGRRGQANFRTPLEQVVGRVAVGVLLGLVGVELGVVRRERADVHGAPGGVRGAH